MTRQHRSTATELAPTGGAAARASDAISVSKRRLLGGTALLAVGVPIGARAAGTPVPGSIRELDNAAMALFDAAEAANWDGAAKALERAKSATLGAKDLERAYIDAGGGIGHFIEAKNNLSADLIEARTALSVKDKRWLISAADRLESRAGELSQPFADQSNAIVPRIETLLFLARRMRRALVWGDDGGFRDARDSFDRLWSPLRSELAGKPSVSAVQEALTSIVKSPTSTGLKKLYAATLALRSAAG
ncbi:MAG: hypothetical protein ABIZ18_03635 [Caldimonas sp.]